MSGMFIEDVDPATFDAPFFNLTRADAIAMDPQQRQLFEVIYECFENGGIQLERISGEEIGCFVGSYTVGEFWKRSRRCRSNVDPFRLSRYSKSVPRKKTSGDDCWNRPGNAE
jgi:acyl transferase domain-containing protein